MTSTCASPPAGTVTDERLKLTAWDAPEGLACATWKLAGVDPLLCSLIERVAEKSCLSSAKPKLTDTANLSPFARATTCDAVDFAGWTSPVPPRLVA